ncbi:MAG: hypothetical protein J6K75_08220 [Erysipelotrichaceae bacterium]|nr:hypothetical protein [Erysipelotrichaceae bacterium]
MNSISQKMILQLLNQCLQSEINIAAFCEEFVFHYLNLSDGDFKTICKDMFHTASDYLMRDTSSVITPEEIIAASEVFDVIRNTHHRLTRHQSQS